MESVEPDGARMGWLGVSSSQSRRVVRGRDLFQTGEIKRSNFSMMCPATRGSNRTRHGRGYGHRNRHRHRHGCASEGCVHDRDRRLCAYACRQCCTQGQTEFRQGSSKVAKYKTTRAACQSAEEGRGRRRNSVRVMQDAKDCSVPCATGM